MLRFTAALHLLLVVLCLIPEAVFAQPVATTLWIPLTDEESTVSRELVEGIIHDVLLNADDAFHVVGLQGIEEYIGRGGLPLPPCLEGREPCGSPYHAVVQSFDANRVITLVAYGEGETVDVIVGDGETEQETLRYEGPDLRTNLFTIVSDLTGLSGTLMVQSEPTGAQVSLDGESLGATPIEVSLPVGSYEIAIEADGYYRQVEGVELRANDTTIHRVALTQRFASVSVRSGTPGALVHFDDEEEGRPVNATYRLEPGTHVMEVRSEGYDTDRRILELVPTDEREYSVVLQLSRETLRARAEERIQRWPLLLQVGVTGLLTSDDLRGATGRAFGETRDVTCPTSDLSASDCGDRARIGHLGLRADAVYNYRHFEILLFGIGFDGTNLRGDDLAYQLEDTNELVRLTGGYEVSLRLLQPGVRYLLNDRIEPYGRAGVGIAWDRWRGNELPIGPDTSFRQTSLLLELHAGVRYHLNPLVYAYGQGDVGTALGRGFRGGASFGIGMNIPDIFGIQRAIERRRNQPEPRPEVPGEL